ncbi:hypothetical protein [Mucilaginibacter celer]|uniref:DUF2007 domain-containing protein n=1 Tax=Mucilaginibacter celer TaxID=2305508 RepID=A0A494VU17_9SPHI|nr:hypothetical protein [Mucilaginibacter celer]AYL98444.1 hypothetical protein HYN43_025570 [Mucilaginibacter celer]
MPEFITFSVFDDAPAAWQFTGLLDENDIEYQSEESAISADVDRYNNKIPAVKYIVKIKPDDFIRAAELLKNSEEEGLEQDTQLFEFTDAELMEILERPDEWRISDYNNAREQLAERGVDVSDNVMARLKRDREIALAAYKESQKGWITAGYILAFAGGLLGLVIGWRLAFQKRALPDGWRVYEYNEGDRKHGELILLISFMMSLFTVIYEVMTAISKAN